MTSSWRTSAASIPHAENIPGTRRHDDRPDADLCADLGGMHGPGTAEGEQRELARIEAAGDRELADRERHLAGDDPKDPFGSLVDIEAERLRHPFADCVLGGLEVEGDLAAEHVRGAEPSEHEIRVGHGRLDTAAAVADGAGNGAGAFGADAKLAGALDPGDRSRRPLRSR